MPGEHDSIMDVTICITNSNPDSAQIFFQIWESDSCSDSGNHRCSRKSAVFVLKQWYLQRPRRFLLVPKIKTDSGCGFSQIFYSSSGSDFKKKKQNLARVDSSTSEPWTLLVSTRNCANGVRRVCARAQIRCSDLVSPVEVILLLAYALPTVLCFCCRVICGNISAAANQKPLANKDLCTRKSVKRILKTVRTNALLRLDNLKCQVVLSGDRTVLIQRLHCLVVRSVWPAILHVTTTVPTSNLHTGYPNFYIVSSDRESYTESADVHLHTSHDASAVNTMRLKTNLLQLSCHVFSWSDILKRDNCFMIVFMIVFSVCLGTFLSQATLLNKPAFSIIKAIYCWKWLIV